MSIFMPEVYIRFYLLKALTEISENVSLFSNFIFGNSMIIGDFDMKKEFENIFSSSLPFNIKFGVNVATVDLPSVQIYLPQEEEFFKGIGSDSSFEYDVLNDEIAEDNELFYKTNYSLMIIDNNADKVLIIYNVLKYMFYRYSHLMEMDGFQNLKISGNDLQQQQNILPQTIFARSINLDFSYTFTTRNALTQLVGKSLTVDKTIKMEKPK